MSYNKRQKLKLKKGRPKNPYKINIDKFINESFKGKYIWVPELVSKIFNEYHFNIEHIKKLIIHFCTDKNINFYLISEDFLKYWEKRFYPKLKGKYYIYYLIFKK